MVEMFIPRTEEQKVSLIRWTCGLLPRAGGIDPKLCEVLGVTDRSNPSDPRLLAVAIYHEYRPAYDQIELTAASKTPRWCTRGVMRALLHYPFEQLGCRKLICMIEAKNDAAIRFADKAGMKREASLRHHFGQNRTGFMYSMMATEYRRSRWAIRHDALEPV